MTAEIAAWIDFILVAVFLIYAARVIVRRFLRPRHWRAARQRPDHHRHHRHR